MSNDNQKKYGGIVGAKESEIRGFITGERIAGAGFRDIAKAVSNNFGVKVSHQTIIDYWKEVCNGETLDSDLDSIERAGLTNDKGAPPTIDNEILKTLLSKHGKDEKGRLYAYAVALCESNIKAHIEGKERLKPEYIQYLRLIEVMRKEK